MEIDELPGVGPSTAEKLREYGFETIESIATSSSAELKDLGIGEGVALKIIDVARKSLDMGFETGLDALEKRKQVD